MPASIFITSDADAIDGLEFESMSATMGFSQIGEMQLTLLSEKVDLRPEKDLLGTAVSITVLLRDDRQRHFHGYVTRFGAVGHLGRKAVYQMTVHPWLWFLTRTSDCRIFQEMSVPDIVKKVFADHAVANTEFKLFRPYRTWTYCVQYRETDYNFIARLLEHEGIYWYFQHEDGQHKLVLVDSSSVHDAMPGCELLPFMPGDLQHPDTDCINTWSASSQVRSGKCELTSYDFERPSTSLLAKIANPHEHPQADHEVFDFQGDYTQKADGDQWVGDRLDEAQTPHLRIQASSNATGIDIGRLLSIDGHPRENDADKFLITGLSVHARSDAHESGGLAGDYRCEFSAIPQQQQYRPPRRTPKPFVQGPQTAIVVGPAGEEIHTDKYGRVKVQFHWDRYGQKNDKSSCWARVSQPWAGKNFGGIHIPRIGQEVVVSFLEGDPDQPLITGRVYNAEQMPPWDLPGAATQSGILTRSSKGGGYGNANAIRFEDKQGTEQLWIHAEKNQDIEVENDETHWVGHDRKKTVDHDETVHVKHDRTETVDNNETITIGVDRTETVGQDQTDTVRRDHKEVIERDRSTRIGANHTETIGAAMSITVGTTLTESVAANYSEAVGGAMELTVGGALVMTAGGLLAETVGGVKSESVAGAKTEEIGASKSVSVGGNLTDSVRGNRDITTEKGVKQSVADSYELEIKKNWIVKAKKVQIAADDEIHLKAGSAEILLKKNGDITIKGNKISIKGDGDVIIKGSKIKEN